MSQACNGAKTGPEKTLSRSCTRPTNRDGADTRPALVTKQVSTLSNAPVPKKSHASMLEKQPDPKKRLASKWLNYKQPSDPTKLKE
ncbi:hypothetical protein NDU88_007658 [Pleurodeles waltl]|uniref:Uncharacterized protein n=1 Tax=Pleurodeles waltl TaxID=8319 RepID=A0AAV7VTA9_PLEWA|nr:hypothetical protein NDU88_007658 [Pleurodeles waltl]